MASLTPEQLAALAQQFQEGVEALRSVTSIPLFRHCFETMQRNGRGFRELFQFVRQALTAVPGANEEH